MLLPGAPGAEASLLRRGLARSAALAYLLNLADLLDREVVVTALPYSLSVRP